MKQVTNTYKTALILSWIIAVTLVLLPFHAFLTVWLSSIFSHYTLLRLWKEFLFIPILLGWLYLLLSGGVSLKKVWFLNLTKLIAIYAGIILVATFWPLVAHNVTAKAAWYGLLVDLRFLIFFLAALVITAKSDWLRQNWQKILFAPAILVAVFAVLQYLVLPYDFLKHFGYSDSTISPYETINHNLQHLRVASTLRGANPLGAYLILPLSALATFFYRQRRQRLNISLFGSGLLLALIFSFSRSAWIGAVISLLVIVWLAIRNDKLKKYVVWISAGCLIVGALLAIWLRNNTTFENIFLHTQHNSAVATNSNENHAKAFKGAASDIINQPLGRGVGTAGPQSVYNHNRGRIAENYFLQIGQEAGVVAMLLFVAICIETGRLLYLRRADPLALALFASLIGITFVNLLSHAWTDDTLAYIWWGLAGVALAPAIVSRRKTQEL